MSLLFYAWGEPEYIKIMISIILINYCAGIIIDKFTNISKIVCGFTIIFNLCILGFYKYLDFIIDNINYVFDQNYELYHIVLPIGISFYIFQSLSYSIDVYRKVVPAQYNIIKFALYVSLFPQLVAGPIVKYKDILQYLDKRNEKLDDVVYGFRRFIIGLGKKVILANTMGEVTDKVFVVGADEISASIAWLGIVSYSLQLFFDFSGYSDMAIGLGRMFGFKFQENFNYPYDSSTMSEFWRKWHISLMSWFREYLYFPLGGSRVSEVRQYANLCIIFIATGIWHGANWTFIAWGVWNGLFLVFEKITGFRNKVFSRKQRWLLHIYVMVIFWIGLVFFRSDNLSESIKYLQVMFFITNNEWIPYTFMYYFNSKVFIFGIISIILSKNWTFDYLKNNKLFIITKDVWLIFVLIYSISSIAASGYNPFIYFRF
jgi:alginate O-acetyltransferase complex protein AlgI